MLNLLNNRAKFGTKYSIISKKSRF